MESLLMVVSLFAVAVSALVLALVVVRLLDRWIFPNLSFEQALRENNLAVAVFLAALVLGLFLLVGRAVAAPGPYSDRYDDDFRREARYRFGYAYDWRWFKAQGVAESGLDPAVCSAAGACGLMQFMPGTALAMGVTDRFNARASIRAGIAYDRRLWDEFTAPRPKADRL
ncbi:MAG: transglycosylase SLT domain-containing protein, partial [Deltaproteobacteria bacterium]|nr:transglycosylase SLT domain-containing protein [Deltaproteobacteria bacterium]